MVSSVTLRSRSKVDRAANLVLALGGLLAVATLGACVDPPQRQGQAQDTAPADATAASEPAGSERVASIPAAGWNERIAWRGLDEGLREAKQRGAPVMMVIHTDWCGNCQKLKRSFADAKLEELSEQFVMVHIDQDQHPEATLYGPDGQYIPRVLFLDDEGKVDPALQNPRRAGHPYLYFYSPQEDLVATMRQALDRHGNKS